MFNKSSLCALISIAVGFEAAGVRADSRPQIFLATDTVNPKTSCINVVEKDTGIFKGSLILIKDAQGKILGMGMTEDPKRAQRFGYDCSIVVPGHRNHFGQETHEEVDCAVTFDGKNNNWLAVKKGRLQYLPFDKINPPPDHFEYTKGLSTQGPIITLDNNNDNGDVQITGPTFVCENGLIYGTLAGGCVEVSMTFGLEIL